MELNEVRLEFKGAPTGLVDPLSVVTKFEGKGTEKMEGRDGKRMSERRVVVFGAPEVLGLYGLSALAVDSTNFYWLDSSTVAGL
jgi:hypothetical protein